jgi:hypothetical protein
LDQTDTPILGGMASDDLRRRVYGAVIHHQNFQASVCLRANATKRLIDRPGSIESGYDHRNEVGFAHGSASPSRTCCEIQLHQCTGSSSERAMILGRSGS